MTRASIRPSRAGWRRLCAGSLLLAAAGCTDVGIPGLGAPTHNSVPPTATAAPPTPDSRGVISFPNYQAVRARKGDTVTIIAQRLGVDAAEMSTRNGLPPNTPLREGELLVLPVRLPPETAAAPGDDLAALATTALDRADGGTGTAAARPATPSGSDPVRHTVTRGETAYSIARLYNVSVRSLADWNGLSADYTVREGQVLLIPMTQPGAIETTALTEEEAAPTPPGKGSPTPEPPSASKPQPREEARPAPATTVAAAPLNEPQTSASQSTRLATPVDGRILRPYAKGKNDGVDFSTNAGAPVVAADAGTVAAITRDVDQRSVIVVRHDNNLLTVYAGVDGISVAKGDPVRRGQKIAVVRAGDQPFLHFEVREGFESKDPVPLLTQ